MMSGPDPGALPMINRIGLSGNTGCAACATGTAASAEMAIAAHSLKASMGISPPVCIGNSDPRTATDYLYAGVSAI